MPDNYNPAVAAGIQPPQAPPENNFASTLGIISNLQERQAQTGLYTLQGLRLQQEMQARQNAISAAGGMDPTDRSALAAAAEHAAQTRNLNIEAPGLRAQAQQRQTEATAADQTLRSGVAKSLYTDQSDQNWQAQLPTLMGHVSPQGWTQIFDAMAHPEKRAGVATSMMSSAMSPAEIASGVQPGQPGQPPTAGGPAQAATGPKLINPITSKYLNEDGAKQYANAQSLKASMVNVDHDIETLGPNWMGAGSETKFNAAKTWNSMLDTAGIKGFHIDPTKVGSWEEFNKETTRAGMQLINANFGGSREAASIIQMGRSAVPNAENTYYGAKLVSATIKAANQRMSDLYEYQAAHPDQLPAQSAIAFNKLHAPEEYAMRGITSIIPDEAKRVLLSKKDVPGEKASFDKTFGAGTADFLTK